MQSILHSSKINTVLLLCFVSSLNHACAEPVSSPPDSGVDISSARAADLLRKQYEGLSVEKQIDALTNKGKNVIPPSEGPAPIATGWGGESFEIREISIENDDLDDKGRNILARYSPRTLGANEIVGLIRELNNYYAQQGYVTTIVTVPPQNLSTGRLVVRVQWGRIGRVKVNNRDFEDLTLGERLELGLAMPNLRGSILNIRTLDQMVDNLSTLRKSIKIKIEPSSELGKSNLHIQTTHTGIAQAALSLDNSGSTRPDGRYKASVQVSTADVLSMNDRLTLTAGHRFFTNSNDSKENSAGILYSIPIGFWSVEGAYSVIRTRTPLPTIYGTYSSEGTLKQSAGKFTRLLFRDATNILNGWGKVLVRNNANYFEGYLIDVSSKSYTQVSMGLTHTKLLESGYLYSELSFARGVPWLSGDMTTSTDNGPSAKYNLVRGSLIWQYKQQLPQVTEKPIIFTLKNGFQWSETPLLGLDKFMFGDEYTVRGFKNSPFSGDKGFYLSTDAAVPLDMPGSMKITPRVGLDIGAIKNNTGDTKWMWGTAFSAGLDFATTNGNLAVNIGVPLKKGISGSSGIVFFVSANLIVK